MSFTDLVICDLGKSDKGTTLLEITVLRKDGKLNAFYVDIRVYDKQFGKLRPTKNGICFTAAEFIQLCDPLLKNQSYKFESNGHEVSTDNHSLLLRLNKMHFQTTHQLNFSEKEYLNLHIVNIEKYLIEASKKSDAILERDAKNVIDWWTEANKKDLIKKDDITQAH